MVSRSIYSAEWIPVSETRATTPNSRVGRYPYPAAEGEPEETGSKQTSIWAKSKGCRFEEKNLNHRERRGHRGWRREMLFLRAFRVLCFALSLECRLRLESGGMNSILDRTNRIHRIEEDILAQRSQRRRGNKKMNHEITENHERGRKEYINH